MAGEKLLKLLNDAAARKLQFAIQQKPFRENPGG